VFPQSPPLPERHLHYICNVGTLVAPGCKCLRKPDNDARRFDVNIPSYASAIVTTNELLGAMATAR
jgi:hypothetical protein